MGVTSMCAARIGACSLDARITYIEASYKDGAAVGV
jgi:hypothetical protein